MPFAADFEDVYAVIKTTVESAISDPAGRCFRLDESRPAGRVTDRLLTELRSATICIADLTETKPNVMWELGFAMALEKPTIIITQNPGSLPFDVHDMQSITYQRNRLNATLADPLKNSVLDTFGMLSTKVHSSADVTAAALGDMRAEMDRLKSIVAEVVTWKLSESKPLDSSQPELRALAGHWFNTESESHIYSRVVRGELVSPYCYGGNGELTGVYFGWHRIGEYWYARYQWLDQNISGFSFLQMDSLEKMSGAWWYAEDESSEAILPVSGSGVPASWVKQTAAAPSWAEDFFREVEEKGLARLLTQSR